MFVRIQFIAIAWTRYCYGGILLEKKNKVCFEIVLFAI